MGYRGDDASRAWEDSRRRGENPSGEYPSADGYGVYEQGPRRDGYNGYDGYDRPAGGFPDNDWYGGSRAGGFADTSIHVRPNVPDDYRPGDYDTRGYNTSGYGTSGYDAGARALPAPPSLEAPPGADRLTQTRQQPVLDDPVPGGPGLGGPVPGGRAAGGGQYGAGYPGYENYPGHENVAYPGYENVDDQQGGYGTGGYLAQQGYDDYDDYADFTPDYDVPAPTTANPVLVEPAPTTGNPLYPDDPAYPEPGAGYGEPGDDSFDGQGPAPGTGGTRARPGRRQTPPGKIRNTGGGRRRRRVVVFSMSALSLIVAAAAAYVFLINPSREEATANAPLPSPGSTSAATAACVKKFGQYCHIETRTDDPKPLTISEVFPPAVADTKDHVSFQRIDTKTDKTCSNAVLGTDLATALQKGGCSQALRASYISGSGSGQIVGTIGVVNLATTNQAHYAGKIVGQSDFLSPLPTSSGPGSVLGKSTGVMQSQFKGHYLILTWAELASEATPTDADNQKLMKFENDLVSVTANIALSQRMVSGKPGSGD